MAHYAWSNEHTALVGTPYPEIYIRNLRAQPMGDGVLRLLLVEHPQHGAAWDAMEEHGLSNEVALIIDGQQYYYYAEVGDEDDSNIYLFPVDGMEQKLPDNSRFLEKAFNLKLRW